MHFCLNNDSFSSLFSCLNRLCYARLSAESAESVPQSTAVTPTRRLREKDASLNVISYHWIEETHDQELKSHRGGLSVTFNCNSCWFLWRWRRYCQALERARGKRELSSDRISRSLQRENNSSPHTFERARVCHWQQQLPRWKLKTKQADDAVM